MKTFLRLEPVIGNVYRLLSTKPVHKPAPRPDEQTLQKILADNPAHFEVRELLADRLTAAGKLAEAGELRLEGATLVAGLFEENEEQIVLNWEDSYTVSALSMVYASATDHFIIGDYEVAAAMLELLIDCDPEDHLNASEQLGFCYVALEEWELLEEITTALPPDSISMQLLGYWAEFQQKGDGDSVKIRMREKHPELFREWTAEKHDDMPEANSEARRLWLRTETLWVQFPDFIAALK